MEAAEWPGLDPGSFGLVLPPSSLDLDAAPDFHMLK
jgi:hypothetical protein